MTSGQSESVPPELVAGKYRLTRMIGRGGMGSVWEGVHTSLGSRVAVKFIEAEYVNSDEARHRFENEARAAAMLRSKHVVQVHDHGVMPDGRPYIVMEFLAGEPLDRRLDRVGLLSPEDTARIVTQVCRALAKAHELGIVHRDLKPENIFLVWDEEDGADVAKVVDFGIAKFTGTSMGVSSSTRTGSVLGTPYYMSPEQARGLRSVDYRSDLWSVGVIAYRCIVGRLPFEGEAIGDLLVKICTAPLPIPSQQARGLPSHFDAWFHRALARDPSERFASAMELAEALATSCGVSPRRAVPASAYSAAAGGAGNYSAPAMTPELPGSGYAVAAGRAMQPSSGSFGSTTPASGLHQDSASLTAGPTTQTTNVPTKKAPAAALIAAAIGALIVLGGGAVLAAKLFGVTREAPELAVESNQKPIAAHPPAPSIQVKPTEPSAPPSAAPAQSLEPPKPAIEPKPPEPQPASKAKAAVRPAAKPKVALKPAPKPKSGSKPKEIDVGY